jgi:hypothetical protein
MHPTKTTIRRLACTAALALTALAVATGVAAGATSQAEEFIPGVTDFPSALGEAGESSGAVSKEEFVPGVTDFPSALGQGGERAAEARLAQHSPQGLPVYVRVDESGFDWSAAAGGAIAATLLLFAAALAVRTAKRSRVAIG